MSAVDTGDCQCVCVCVCVVKSFQWILTTALAEEVLDVETVEQSNCVVVISSSVLEVKHKDCMPETGHLHFSNNVGSTEWKGPR